MSWESPISTDDVVAIHAVLVPTLNGDGEILMVGGDNHYHPNNSPGSPHNYIHSRRFNCRTRTLIAGTVPTPDFDLFCCGHAFMGDGRPLFAGGTAEFPADAEEIHALHGHFDGHRHSTIYNYYRNILSQSADMNPEPGLGDGSTTGGGRWYPTLCTLGNGDVFIFQGHPKGDDGRHGNNTPERYRYLSGDWVLLPEIGDVAGDPILYSRLHLATDGKVFVSSLVNGFDHTIKINPFDGTVTNVSNLPDGAYHGYSRPAVMLMLSSADSYANKIILCGGTNSQIINLADASPSWSNVPRDVNFKRVNSQATLLPTGKVIINGGTTDDNDLVAATNPEIYDPATNAWTTINDPASVLRNYHSTALLMPDGNIWTGGGNLAGQQPDVPPGDNQKKVEVFVVPYPAGARPVINSCPPSATYGSTFDISTTNGAIISKVVLMRCGSSTHAFNGDQRGISLDFTHTGNTLHATVPANSNIVVPGNYMLFTVDSGGRPCSYAKFIRIGFQKVEIITDRSTFSVLEVDAQPAGNAVFQNAFYVTFDGFLPSELSNFTTAPTITFTAVPGGATISGMTRIHVDTLFENNDLPPDVPQKVTFVFNVKFTNNSAFGFAGPSQDVKITATLLDRKAEAIVNLIKAPNPYMIDGPTSWLSVDVAVFQIKKDSSRATIVQGDSGTAFIQSLLDRFNNRDIYPGDELHPFNDLVDMQDTSTLDWLETSGGKRVFNYAVAKVRYKAPIPLSPPPDANDAKQVKVFFRMFNTAGTAMQYNPATTYPTAGTGANVIAQIGKEGGLVSSIPFFSDARVDYHTMLQSQQTDSRNMKTIPAKGNTESVMYFGCWLDFNQPAVEIPLSENATHGTSFRNLQTSIRGIHQCLVAEVFFPDDPTAPNATPGSSDNLSQRNLVIVHSDNPGNTSTHTVQHTFEISPSKFKLNDANGIVPVQQSLSSNIKTEDQLPDLIMIHWNNLPPASKITVYIPYVKVDDILALEAYTRSSLTSIVKEDEHTFSFVHSGINYFPVPGGLTKNIPALLTIELPDNVVKGQLFHVLVQQARMYRQTRRIIGSFQFDIPVKVANQILHIEERNLSILKYVRQSMAVNDPWRLIFNRYIKELSNKVDGLGGNASLVPASPDDRWTVDTVPENPGSSSGETGKLGRLIELCCRKSSVFMIVIIILLLVLILIEMLEMNKCC